MSGSNEELVNLKASWADTSSTFSAIRFFPGVADEYWEPVNLALSAREGSWVFKMADRMEQNETGTTEGPTEEFLPGIGELKTFSQVRRQGVSTDLVFDTSRPLVEWIKMCPAPVRKPVHLNSCVSFGLFFFLKNCEIFKINFVRCRGSIIYCCTLCETS